MDNALIASEVKRRRTFAIISHPDAGKTTLTEKLLLYTGKIMEAGEVKAKANRRKTVSDWMELEKQRGISVTSSVLQFEFENLKINLLDTPGHKDFSEDTYRTLMAADTAVMVIDAAKGVETQTKKLFEVCRMRHIPILTFVNKMDRECRDPFELMKELEDILKITANPVTWPIGMGDRFKGVYHRLNKEFIFFEPSEKVGERAEQKVLSCEVSDPRLLEFIDAEQQQKLIEDLELIEGALGSVDKDLFLAGELTPTLFGSARNNFGISSFLEIFHDFTPSPQPKLAKPHEVLPEDSS
jgi:peptide chain release factor 3